MKHFLFKNGPVKIICISAASLLWFYVASGQQMVAKFPGSIKISPVNVTAGLIPVYDEKSTEIRIMASQSDWQKLSAEAFSATIDLSGLTVGTHEVPVNVTALLPGVSVIDEKPSKILVTLDPLIAKEIPITKKIEGNAAEGMVAGSVEFVPSKVTIKGAKSLLENIEEATGTIILSGQNANFKASVALSVTNAAGHAIGGVEVLPSEAEASVSIVKGSNVKSLGIKPQISGRVGSGYYIENIEVNPGVLEVTGPRNLINDLSFIQTAAIDVDGLSNSIDKDVVLELPDNLTVLGGGITKARVSVKIAPVIVSQRFTLKSFKIDGFDREIISFNPAEISVTATGPLNSINQLNLTGFSPQFSSQNLVKIDERSYLLNIGASAFSLPEGIFISNVEPSTLVVNVK